MNYLMDFGLSTIDIDTIASSVTDDIYSDLTFMKNIVSDNIAYMRDFGVTNYSQVVVKYPEVFLRDTEKFKHVFAKFDKEDLIQKVAKNVAVFKKMVDYVDNM